MLHDEARIQDAKLQQEIIKGYKEDKNDLIQLCEKDLSEFAEFIQEKFKIGDKIPKKNLEKLNKITDILNTGMSKLGQEILLYGRKTLWDTIFPPPEQLTHPLKIFHIGIKTYKMCLEKAISLSNSETVAILLPKVREAVQKKQELSNNDKKFLNARNKLENR